MNKGDRALLLRFSRDALKNNNKGRMACAAVLSLAKAGISILPPLMVMRVLDVYIPERDLNRVLFFSVIIILVTIISNSIDVILEYIFGQIGKSIYLSFQGRALDKLFYRKGRYYSEMSTGDVMTTLIQDIDSVRQILSSIIFEFISDAVVAIAMFFFLARIDIELTIVVVITLPIIFFVQRRFQKSCMEKAKRLREVDGEMTSLIEDCVSNIRSYVTAGFKNYFFRKHGALSDLLTTQEIKLDVTINLNHGAISCIGALLNVFILSYGGIHVVIGTMSIGGLIAYNMYAQRLISPILQLTSLLTEMQIFIVSITKIYSLLDEKNEDYGNLCSDTSNSIEGDLCLNHISFSYDDTNMIFKDASVTFTQGKIYGVIGESGSGKSTLTNLIFKLWDAGDSAITWGGKPINQYEIDFLRRNISMVGQDNHLLDDTVYNNISLGDESITKEDVKRIAKIVEADNFIMNLEKQYDTLIGEKGVKLSGGQKQRIALARAIIRKRPLLILDEATSALDKKTENKIMQKLVKEIEDSIIIIVSHRMSMLCNADEIYVVEDKTIKRYR